MNNYNVQEALILRIKEVGRYYYYQYHENKNIDEYFESLIKKEIDLLKPFYQIKTIDESDLYKLSQYEIFKKTNICNLDSFIDFESIDLIIFNIIRKDFSISQLPKGCCLNDVVSCLIHLSNKRFHH